MLRVQPTAQLGALEKETLANLARDGLRETQFVKGLDADRERAEREGWAHKLLEFKIPDSPDGETFEAVLDSLAGFTRCGDGCAVFKKLAEEAGVLFKFGAEEGAFDGFLEERADGPKRAIGIRTKDGQRHLANTVVVAGELS